MSIGLLYVSAPRRIIHNTTPTEEIGELSSIWTHLEAVGKSDVLVINDCQESVGYTCYREIEHAFMVGIPVRAVIGDVLFRVKATAVYHHHDWKTKYAKLIIV